MRYIKAIETLDEIENAITGLSRPYIVIVLEDQSIVYDTDWEI
jgi:hypothetical protein